MQTDAVGRWKLRLPSYQALGVSGKDGRNRARNLRHRLAGKTSFCWLCLKSVILKAWLMSSARHTVDTQNRFIILITSLQAGWGCPVVYCLPILFWTLQPGVPAQLKQTLDERPQESQNSFYSEPQHHRHASWPDYSMLQPYFILPPFSTIGNLIRVCCTDWRLDSGGSAKWWAVSTEWYHSYERSEVPTAYRPSDPRKDLD